MGLDGLFEKDQVQINRNVNNKCEDREISQPLLGLQWLQMK